MWDRRKGYPLKLHFKDEGAVGRDTVGDPLGSVCEVGGDDDESVARLLHSQHSFLPALVQQQQDTTGALEGTIRSDFRELK